MRQYALFTNILPVLLGNPATFVAAVAIRLFTAFAGLKARRVNKCAPYYPVGYGGGPALVQGYAVPVETNWPTPYTFQEWKLWNAWDLWCSHAKDQAALGRSIPLPILTWQQRAAWKGLISTGGYLWRSSGRVALSSQPRFLQSGRFLGAEAR